MRIAFEKEVVLAVAGILTMILVNGCIFPGKILKNEPIGGIPDKPYEDIIILDTPDRMPLEPAAGYVYIEPGGNVKTDFARETFVKVLPMFDRYEQINRDNMGKFVIRDSTGKLRGYYEILFDYRVHLWENGDTILLQIILPQDKSMKDNDFSPANAAPGAGK